MKVTFIYSYEKEEWSTPLSLVHELFIDGEDIIYYDNIVDCINKLNYYQENSEERERIAKNGYNKVLENHTQKQRVEFIIKN